MFPSPQIKAELATPQVVPTSQDVQARKGRFGGMMVVIHGLQGKPYTCTHDIEFNLDDTFFSCISTWVNRKASPDEVSQSVCISLACYRLPDLFATIQSESQLQGIAELTSHSSCSWPTSGRLSLQIERHSKHYVIPLCPPVILTPDNCVDVSSFMSSGHNTFRLTQQGDLSEFAFVFHAHHPSDAQLAELNAVAVASKRWKELVGWLGSPIGSQSPWVTFTSSSIPPS
ncbi:hypothetical protein F5I97DRAFT_1812910 [Phlebopus sp. FC_14]|nr:hypothetical protein F5I97DRAFT_1812910 [Phlebopus sp. FC_14]